MENADEPLPIQTGKFYNFEMHFATHMNFEDGLQFQFKLVDAQMSGSYEKIIDYGGTNELNGTGDDSLSIDTLIPTDVPDGKYILLMNIVDPRLGVDDSTLNPKTVSTIAQLGSVMVDIIHGNDSKRIDIVDSVNDNGHYVDLPKSMEYDSGYTKNMIGNTRLVIYNSSHLEHNITVSATLELSDGTVFNLGILDTNRASVVESATATIKVLNPSEIGVGDVTLNYYVQENDYERLLELVPDLSEDNSTDGINGIIKWRIETLDSDVVTNDTQTDVVLSKYDDDFVYNPEELEAVSKYRGTTVGVAISEYRITKDYDRGNGIVQDWTTNNSKFCLKQVDAMTLDPSNGYNYYFVFSSDKFTYYNLKSDKCLSTKPLSQFTINGGTIPLNFKTVTAAFSTPNGVYLIGINKNTDKYDVAVLIKSGYSYEDIHFIGDSLSKHIDLSQIKSAVSYDGKRIWFTLENNTFRGYDITENLKLNESSTVNFSFYMSGGLSDWKNLGDVSPEAMAYFADAQNLLILRNKPVGDLSKLKALWAKGILFQVDEKFNEEYGDSSRASAKFTLNYGTIGSWKDLYVRAYGNAGLVTSLFSTKNTIFNVESEVIAGVDAKYQSSSSDKSRIGAKLKIDIMNNTWYEKDTITEKKKTETISDPASKQKAVADSKEQTKDKGFKLPNKEWKEKRILFSYAYVAGAVPIMIAGGVEGNLTLNTGFELEGIGAYLTGEVTGKIEAFVEGGLSASILKVTLVVNAVLADSKIEGKVGAEIKLDDANDFIFGVNAQLETTLQLLRVDLRADIFLGWTTFDWSHFDLKYNIWSSPWAFDRKYTLLDYELPLITIPTGY